MTLTNEELLKLPADVFYDVFLALCHTHRVGPILTLKKLGISPSATWRWKQGSLPSAEHLCRIAIFFNVSVDYLLQAEIRKIRFEYLINAE